MEVSSEEFYNPAVIGIIRNVEIGKLIKKGEVQNRIRGFTEVQRRKYNIIITKLKASNGVHPNISSPAVVEPVGRKAN